MNTSTTERQDEIDVSFYVTAAKRYWKHVLGLAVLAAILTIVYVTIRTPEYQARTVVLLVDQQPTMSPVAQLLGQSEGLIDMLRGVVESKPTVDAVKAATGLSAEDARNYIKVKKEGEKKQLIITATDENKERALVAVKTALATLEDVNRRIGFSAASKQATFLEQAVADKRKELASAQREFADYQQRMKAPFDPSDVGSAVEPVKRLRELEFELDSTNRRLELARNQAANAAAAGLTIPTELPASSVWRPRVVQLDHDLHVAQIKLGPKAPEVVRLKRELAETIKRGQAEIAKDLQAVQKATTPEYADLLSKREVLQWQVASLKQIAATSPSEAVRLTSLYQNVQTLVTVLQALEARYEEARVNAQVDTVRWSILEQPYILDKPVNKSRTRPALLMAFLGALVGAVWASRKYRYDLRTAPRL